MAVFDDRGCELGEGPLWHPGRGQLFWFDILGNRLLARDGETALAWDFGEHVSAAGWIDRDRLMVASETALWIFEIATGRRERLMDFAADTPHLRSNDGRADPWGGFWIGTMAKAGETGPGAIWRYYRGELRAVVPDVMIPNALCFDAAREVGYFADTERDTVWCQALDPASGWPKGEPRVFLDLREAGLHPDGAVLDAEGRFWNAQWGAGRVACYGPDGRLLDEIAVPAARSTCPAFGGAGLDTLFVTSARVGLDADALAAQPEAGMTFAIPVAARGVPEPAVVLG